MRPQHCHTDAYSRTVDLHSPNRSRSYRLSRGCRHRYDTNADARWPTYDRAAMAARGVRDTAAASRRSRRATVHCRPRCVHRRGYGRMDPPRRHPRSSSDYSSRGARVTTRDVRRARESRVGATTVARLLLAHSSSNRVRVTLRVHDVRRGCNTPKSAVGGAVRDTRVVQRIFAVATDSPTLLSRFTHK
jgi:hypothetical protein